MAQNDPLTQPIKIDDLLLSKRLEPLGAEHAAALDAIAKRDVIRFSEAEVRAYVIDPIVRILGYDKNTIFSADLEHPLKFLGRNLFPDYKVALWNENFWLIEAKRPKPQLLAFEYEELAQVIEYSIHPSINAALVALCDGVKFEVFDREVSVEAPMLTVEIKNLVRDFDKIRAILEPMQVWFFQKRRVVRLIDKVLNKEFNMNRVEEFSALIERRIQGKRQLVVENFRSTIKSDAGEDAKRVSTADAVELVELYLFTELPIPLTNAVNHRLVELSKHNSFHVMYRMFPDHPRDVNEIYMGQGLLYLMRLGEQQPKVGWIPSWLTQGAVSNADVESATAYLLKQCLTYFETNEAYRVILLAGCAIQRIAKIMAISNNAVRHLGQNLHALARHELPELSWAQILASPEGQLIGLMDGQSRSALRDFIKRHKGGNGEFLTESAKATLKSIWELENKLLASVGNYAKLRKERSLGEMRIIEWSAVTYDNLGHLSLCLMHGFPKWKAHVLAHYLPQLEALVSLGSWKAREMLGISKETKVEPLPDAQLAARFFFGDEATLTMLRAFYHGG
jgi:hypothetical protein